MRKILIFLAMFIFLISSVFIVVAAGSSTGNAQDTRPATTTTAPQQIRNCEGMSSLEERIKCRMTNRRVAGYTSTGVEEACRGRASEQACIALYNRSESCYQRSNAREKKTCFLEKSGININARGTFRAAPSESKRNYAVLLLYELQERIEALEESGNITTDEASILVTQIVEIKRLILDGSPKSEIVPKMREFKNEFREIMSGVSQ